jgi:Rieske Fe-S protein
VTSLDRRTVLKATCAGCAGLALAACGGGDSTDEAAPSPATSPGTSSPTSPDGPLVKLADIKVGNAVATDGGRVLVTRTGESTAVAFNSTCTHMGCTVEAAGKKLACPCHGSVYDAATAKVLEGPAPAPLRSVPVVVRDGSVFKA